MQNIVYVDRIREVDDGALYHFYREGIDWCEVEWADNSECLDLVEKNMGIISLINEESRFPKGTDNSLLQKLHNQHMVRMVVAVF